MEQLEAQKELGLSAERRCRMTWLSQLENLDVSNFISYLLDQAVFPEEFLLITCMKCEGLAARALELNRGRLRAFLSSIIHSLKPLVSLCSTLTFSSSWYLPGSKHCPCRVNFPSVVGMGEGQLPCLWSREGMFPYSFQIPQFCCYYLLFDYTDFSGFVPLNNNKKILYVFQWGGGRE